MIKVSIFRNQTGLIDEVKVVGHDESMPHGQSIVCAAVSTLAQTALLGIGKHLKRAVDYKVESGNLKFKLKGNPDELTSAVLETMILGLDEIRNIYPNEVRIKEHRR